ncbi:LysR substrate-binding domain-containing protein [Dyella terrae]|uniref:LysR substrate-binding domain-containing protein n=1 Tax=Dyella terrae TaxID=522259 RepID=UPI001EFCF889|nr:LysR substrate-binding domain-containing protein [Dyella terrae]ULU23518.1 LysR family transcriptional regulator [Dyella terrae]
MQDLNDMIFFAEVAERGGFAAASRVLGVPKSRLSRRIAELERGLGVLLLQRTTRKLSLTPVGEMYLRHCRDMRDAAVAATEVIAQLQGTPSGTVRITCPVTLARTTIGPLLLRYMALYPDVHLDVRLIDRPVNLVEEGVDIAIRVRSAIEDSVMLAVKQLNVIHPLLVISPAQLERQGPVRDPADLLRIDTLDRGSDDNQNVWRLMNPDGHIQIVRHMPRLIMRDLPLLKKAAVSGLGAAMLPDYMLHAELANGTLIEPLRNWKGLTNIVYALFSPRSALMPAVRKLIDFLYEHAANVVPTEDDPRP